MISTYYPPKCNGKDVLVKSRCQCKKVTIKKNKPKKVLKITVKKKPGRKKPGRKTKKKVIKCSILKKRECKKRKKICNLLTGRCKNPKKKTKNIKRKSKKKSKKKNAKRIKKAINPTEIIENNTPTLAKELRKVNKTYSPSINRQLMSLKSVTPKGDIYNCPNDGVMVKLKNGKKCFGWNSKRSKDIMLRNLNTTRPIIVSEIMAPIQNQSNCWMNSFFVTWFISDGGRKFNRWFRQAAITGKLPNGTSIPSKFKRPAFLLNKMIDASLRGGNDPSRYAELMDTNDIIRSFHRAAPQSGIVKTRVASNPLSFYSTIYKAITGLKGAQNYTKENSSWVENGPLNWLNFVAFGKDTKTTLQNHIRNSFKVSQPQVIFIETFDSDANIKKHKILSFNENGKKISYKLDAAVLRNTTKIHFSAYVTINNVDYGFDGESYSRLEKFNWKNKLNKNTQWRFTEKFETYFNFVKCYSMLIYYRIK